MNPESNVLLVDDDPAILREYSKVAMRAGATVTTARNGQEALHLLAERGFDAVVTDLVMPVMGGLAFLKAVRRVDLDIPVILMTGTPELGTAVTAMEYGAFHYLIKPVEPRLFRTTLERALRFRELTRLQRLASAADELPELQLPDRASLEARFESALERLWVAFQPIVRWSDKCVFAYEALVRSDEPELGTPDRLFDVAEKLDRTMELGRMIRKKVADLAPQVPETLLFVNVNPTDLADEELYSSNHVLAPEAARVVFEITERSELTKVDGLTQRLTRLRNLGYRLAIDDLGAGYSSLSSFVHMEPQFVKIDMSLVRDLHLSARKRSLVRGLSQICQRDLSIQVVCEGVEVDAERQALVEEGIDLLQGYLFAKPARTFVVPRIGDE